MTDPMPIACSLSSAAYRERVAGAGQVARAALRARAPLPGGVRLTFADTGDVRTRLERLVAAESECCPFLTMDLRRQGDELRLDVTGPAEAAPIIAELFASSLPESGPAVRRARSRPGRPG